VRSKYLLPHIESLGIRITELVANEAMLSTAQRRTLDRLRKELDECREYHDRLHLVADRQIAFDLDDGVVVNHAKFGDVLAKIK
jgi:urease accessory protein UreE